MKKGWKIVLAILCAFVIAAGSFIAAVQYLNTRYAAALSARDEDSPVQAKAAEVQKIIGTYFIDDYDEDTLADGAASGMVDATGDEWSYYLSADEVAAYEESMANAYVGVGITITEDAEAGGMRVEEVAAGGPAEEAGIRVGDLLLAVEGEDVLPLGIDGTRNLVRGEEGTRVNMHFSRNGSEYDVSVERRSIETPVVTGELLDGSIGYIKIDNFDERSAYQIVEGIYNSVITNDITKRHNIMNFDLFNRVVKYIVENVGKTFSANAIAKFLKSEGRSLSVEAVYNYLNWLEKAFVIYRCQRYDLQGKSVLKTQEKFYLADASLKYCIMGFNPKSIAAMLENIVYFELRRRGYEVYIGKNETKEIDFVAVQRDERIYVQVCRRLPEESDREVGNLLEIKDHYPKYVVTLDELAAGNINGVKIVHLADFLLSDTY